MNSPRRKYSGDHFVGALPRLTCSVSVQTFDAKDFAGTTINVLNTKSSPSFVKVGMLRHIVMAGEELPVLIPKGADYRIEFGTGVRLL